MFVWKMLALLAAAGLAGGCFAREEPGAAPPPAATAPADEAAEREPPEAEGEAPYAVLAEKLRTPWAIAFDGETMLVSEREGSVVRIGPDGSIVRKPVVVKPGVAASGESGFLGFALAPDFAETKTAFAYHTYEANGRMWNRIVALEEQEEAWVEKGELLSGIPGSRIHDGGRLAIGPDGHLYATTGDAGEEAYAQDLNNLAGKILRLTTDGGVPADNPFPGSYVYSYGHRNVQGVAWTAEGVMYASEHGPSGDPGGHDEINAVEAGGNYGWPDVYGDAKKNGMIPPLYHSGEPPAIAPSGIAVAEDGALLVATLRGEALLRFDPARPTPAGESLDGVARGYGRLRDVAVRDGYAYVLTNNTDGRGTPGATDDRLLRFELP
ncbi:PQQ-dependent sugar dehydrogenase [Paenibacillus sp.]|uniref:PQQ-dependent sugar dehydrogenase n=1 Tax=Paenibacillus sp. TaxID=58172 RepID=UPI002812312B|nr:PQQ-dependent sugar dehydrogenase [Paenibacillus sp.]